MHPPNLFGGCFFGTTPDCGPYNNGLSCSPPAERRRDLGQDRLDDMGIVGDAELVGDGEEQRIGLSDRFVLLELLDEHLGLRGIAASEDRARPLVDETDLVLSIASP